MLPIVSDVPRDYLGLERGREGPFMLLPTGPGAELLARSHAGEGSLLGGRPVCEGGSACGSHGAASFTLEVVR
jgi:hypothetical protein